ncbi:uncharacterized protein J3R85_015580 [Psidium guajava]|nr:uncharacterized protein J3R85_015580 [Psidium guajava]
MLTVESRLAAGVFEAVLVEQFEVADCRSGLGLVAVRGLSSSLLVDVGATTRFVTEDGAVGDSSGRKSKAAEE